MIPVKLEAQAWNQVLALLAQAPWVQANPLIMAIGEQLRAANAGAAATAGPNGPEESIRMPDEPNARQRPS